MKHTPGPWKTHALTKSHGIYDQTGTSVAKVGDAFGVCAERRAADARLIAAAPDLLEALRNLTLTAARYLPDYNEHPDIQAAEAAIAKATQ